MGWRSNLLPDHRTSGQVLPWVIAVMVYLAALAVTGALVLNNSVERWRTDLTHTITVQIAPQSKPALKRETISALKILRNTPGIVSAEPLSRHELNALLEPWLGIGNVPEGLPIPNMIDVIVEPGASIDYRLLERRIQAAAPSATLDSHQRWLRRLITLARSIQVIAGVIVVLVALATVSMVVFATRAGLAADQHVIEVLHLIGARESFIANRFRMHFLSLGLRGGIIGLLVAGLTLAVLARYTSELGAAFIPRVQLQPMEYLVLAGVPVAAAIVTMLTAGIAVKRALSRLT